MSPTDAAAQTIAQQAGEAILQQKDTLAAELVAREFSRHPDLEQRYGAIAREKSLQDAGYHLAYLANALSCENPALFVDYVEWARAVLSARGVRPEDLAFHLECTRETLLAGLPPQLAAEAASYLQAALGEMPSMPDELPSYLSGGGPLSPLVHQYLHALLRGDRRTASRLVMDAVDRGAGIREIYLEVFQPAQREIGRLWQTNKISVAQEHYCTAAAQLIMSQLYPLLFAGERSGPTLVMASVAGELHEIGARMVADFFEMEGWNTFYTGANTPTESVIRTLIEQRAAVLGISATIAFNLPSVEALVRAVRDRPECNGVRIMVGGYPFNRDRELWRKLGADGFGLDAQDAVSRAQELLGARGSQA